jgi:hypothetical protein
MNRLSPAVDAFPGETIFTYSERMESLLASQQCSEREGDSHSGARCERSAAHLGKCECPKALDQWLKIRYGKKAEVEVVFHA